ncbi:MAG: ABC transporter permease subunit [Planctomycetota bacterium]
MKKALDLKEIKDSWLYETYHAFTKNKSAVLGFGIIACLLLSALFAPILAPRSPIEQNLEKKLLPPIWSNTGEWPHVLGTDDFGRDLLSRIIYGARISILIGLISVGIGVGTGIFLGSIAGFYAGTIDAIIMLMVNILLSLPAILLAIVVVSMLGPSLENTMIAIGLVNLPLYIRLVRASVLQEKQKEYVIASRLCGSSSVRLMFIVILPNCMGPIIVQATMGFASAILEAAGLSFLGLGAQPPTPEWGAMLCDSIQFLHRAPWIIVFPGMAIFFSVLGFNLIGDGLMDLLDPKAKD